MLSEKRKFALRSHLLRKLFTLPGMSSSLHSVESHPNVFIDLECGMYNTVGVLMLLPVHPKSSVKLIRPIPKIPGIPPNTTTIPPVYTESLSVDRQPKTYYDFLEKGGKLPSLPSGFTYSPSSFIPVADDPTSTVESIPLSHYDSASNLAVSFDNVHGIPDLLRRLHRILKSSDLKPKEGKNHAYPLRIV